MQWYRFVIFTFFLMCVMALCPSHHHDCGNTVHELTLLWSLQGIHGFSNAVMSIRSFRNQLQFILICFLLIFPLQGWLPGLKEDDGVTQLPTIAIVASYDTFGAAPVRLSQSIIHWSVLYLMVLMPICYVKAGTLSGEWQQWERCCGTFGNSTPFLSALFQS